MGSIFCVLVMLGVMGCMGAQEDGSFTPWDGKTPGVGSQNNAASPSLPSDADGVHPPEDIDIVFDVVGARSGEHGQGSFTFGVATAATQIEDNNEATDWYAWTMPEPEGLGKATFIGNAALGYSNAVADIDLIEALNVDAYRFSIEWARIEPQRGVIDEDALAHYDAFIDELLMRGIRPVVTIHHFSNPVWVDDPRDPRCEHGPSDENLCGWDHPEGASMVIDALVNHTRLLAERFGDRVDEWCTLNEPVNYLLASYGIGEFPPGKQLLLANPTRFIDVVRNYISAHVKMYDAIKEFDTVDATGDGTSAHVGLTLSVADWVPARNNRPSIEPEDIAATERVRYVYHELFPDSILRGAFDPDVNRTFAEEHPDWTGKLDWLGVQYYFRAGVTGSMPIIPLVRALVCFGEFDAGACIPPEDETHYIPSMGYEFYAPGLYSILREFGKRWPSLPLTVSESGIATEVGRRRAEHIVRSLEQIHRAIYNGVDVRGYFHWSLLDNFEWAEGFEPRFGLYFVNYETYERVPTEGVDVLSTIASQRTITKAMREQYGGLGPMTPEH